MKTKVFGALSLLAALLAGCVVQTVHPLFTEKEFVPFPGLVGTWTQKDGDKDVGTWIFKEDERRYTCTQTDEKGHKAIFHVAAGKIGAHVFLDSSVEDPAAPELLNDIAAAHLAATHLFVKVTRTNDALLLTAMNTEWLEKYLEENPSAIACVRREKMPPLITASTEELKKFVTKFAADTKAFQNEILLVPKKAAP